MKILFISSYFHTKQGGLENYLFNLAKYLGSKAGNQIIVISSGKSKIVQKKIVGNVIHYQLPVTFTISNTPIGLTWPIEVYKIFTREKPDIVNAHFPVPFLADIGIYLSKILDIPSVSTYHGGFFNKNEFLSKIITQIYEKSFEYLTFSFSTEILVLNTSLLNSKLKRFNKKTVVIPPGIETQFIHNRKFTPIDKDNLNLIFIGNLDKAHSWKGLEILLIALSTILTEQQISGKLTVLGSGNNIKYYKDLTKNMGLDGNVQFLGETQHSSIPAVLQKQNILVLPSTSDSESFGLVLIEAMANGCLVIGSNIGGIPSVISDSETGLLFEAGNSNDLANKITMMCSSTDLQRKLLEKSQLLVTEKYNYDKNLEAIQNNYKKLL